MEERIKILIFVLISVVILETVFLVYLLLFIPKEEEVVDEQSTQQVEEAESDEIVEQEEDNSGDNQPVEEDTSEESSEYKYSYVTRAVDYGPNLEKYFGYIRCNDIDSTCTMYGVEKTNNTEHIIGENYVLSFSDYECPGAAAGTTYCEVSGEVKVEAFNN